MFARLVNNTTKDLTDANTLSGYTYSQIITNASSSASNSSYQSLSGSWTLVSESYGDPVTNHQSRTVSGFSNCKMVWVWASMTVSISEEITHTGSRGGVCFGHIEFGNLEERVSTNYQNYVDGSDGNTSRTFYAEYQTFIGNNDTSFFDGSSTFTIYSGNLNLRRCTARISWSAKIFGIS